MNGDNMDINTAKTLVVDAGKRLVETGLIARTWGNVSCRVSDTQFVITPSGRAYETLTAEEIVAVNIADTTYDGDIKPSSEKGIHASVYAMKSDINFVIHTHQVYASVISALGFDINALSAESAAIIGDHVCVASYGLPGTGKLKKGVRSALERSDSKAVIMAHHGALCMGADYEEAFKVALELEKVCESFLLKKYNDLSGNIAEGFSSLGKYIADKLKSGKNIAEFEAYDSVRDGGSFSLLPKNGGDMLRVDIETGKISVYGADEPLSTDMHREIYKKRGDVNYIVHSKNDDIVSASKLGITVKPLLDDFAQIVGATLRTADFDPNNTMKTAKKVVKKLKGRDAVMLKNNGAVCVASNEDDAYAVEMVVDKGVKTYLSAAMLERINPISIIDTHLMRFIYKQKYSKQK